MNVHMYVGSAIKEENGDPTSGHCLRTAKKSKSDGEEVCPLEAVQIKLADI